MAHLKLKHGWVLFQLLVIYCCHQTATIAPKLQSNITPKAWSNSVAFCDGKEDGWYANVQESCKKYFICRRKSAMPDEAMACPALQTFDQDSCSCTNRVVACNGTSTVAQPCRPLPAKKVTALASNSPVKGFTCRGRKSGLYPDVKSGCRTYHACVEGVARVFDYQCPDDFRFDSGSCRCVLPALASRCTASSADRPCLPVSSLESNLITTPPQAPPPPPRPNFCRERGPGYYADILRGCEWFYVCMGDDPIALQLQCPPHLRFNHFSCTCQYASSVACHIFDEIPCIPPNFWGNETASQG